MYEIYEIFLTDLNKVDEVFDMMSKYGDLYFKNGRVYIFSVDCQKAAINRLLLRRIGSGNFMLKPVSQDLYDSYPRSLSDWMKTKSYEFEVAKILKQKEEEFKEYKEAIIFLKNKLEEQEKNGGVENAETKGVDQ